MIHTTSLLAAAPSPQSSQTPANTGAPSANSEGFAKLLDNARVAPPPAPTPAPARPTNDTKEGQSCIDDGPEEEASPTRESRLQQRKDLKKLADARKAGPVVGPQDMPAQPTVGPDCELPATPDARTTRDEAKHAADADAAVDTAALLAQMKQKLTVPPIECPGPATPTSATGPSTENGTAAARPGRGGGAAAAALGAAQDDPRSTSARSAADAVAAKATEGFAVPVAETAAEPVRRFAADLQAAIAPGAAGTTAASTTAAAAAPTSAEGRLTAAPGSPEFAQQLGAQISTFIKDGIQNARLELHPVEMGPLTVQIQLDGQAAQVDMSAENAETRQALEQAMPQLAGSLREAGLTLSGGGVFEQPRQSQPENGPQGDTRTERNVRRGAAAEAPLGAVPATALRRRGVVDLVA